jgi:hypothetical protein
LPLRIRTNPNFLFSLPEVSLNQQERETTLKEGQNMLNNGGQTAKAGTYWNLSNGSRVQMEQEGVLPGSGTTRYIKAPVAVMLMAAPVVGLVFAVFLPFIGIVMTLNLVGKKLVQGVESATAGSMSFGWRPIEAYLAGRKARKAARAKKAGKDAGKE